MHAAQQQGDWREPDRPSYQNLMQLTVDTSRWTCYRSRTKNADFGDTFAPAVATLAVNQHPAIPRTDADLNHGDFFQAIVNTAGFHFTFIEQGDTSLYPKLAQRRGFVHPAQYWWHGDH